MKKIALLMALLMLVLSLVACGGEAAKDPQTTNGPEQTGAADATEGTAGEAVEACEHQYEQEVIAEPSCTQKGTMKYRCTVCNNEYTEDISATGHDGSGASCLEPSTCADCGEVVEDAWGHEDEDGLCKHCGIDMKLVSADSGASQTPETTGAAETTEATETTEAAG